TGFPGNRNAALVVENLAHVMASMAERAPNAHQQQAIREIADAAEALRSQRVRPGREGRAYYDDFTILDFEPLIGLIDAALETLPNVPLESHASEDAPKPFDVGQLADFVDDLSADGTSNANVGNFVAFLTLRIRSLLAERRLRAVVDPATQLTLADWLGTYIGEENAKNGQVAILDLSLIPSDTVHIVGSCSIRTGIRIRRARTARSGEQAQRSSRTRRRDTGSRSATTSRTKTATSPRCRRSEERRVGK